jgi:Lon protease-like protein
MEKWSWEQILEYAQEGESLHRKEALSQARVRLIDWLEVRGFDASSGKVQDALDTAWKAGALDDATRDLLGRAIRTRNDLEYRKRAVSREEIIEAVKHIHRVCAAPPTVPIPDASRFHAPSTGRRDGRSFIGTLFKVAAVGVGAALVVDILSHLGSDRQGSDPEDVEGSGKA